MSPEIQDTRVPPSFCRRCDRPLDGAAGRGVPSPGDVSVCGYCATLSIFTEDLGLRSPTSTQVDAIIREGPPELGRIVAAIWDKRGRQIEVGGNWWTELPCGCRFSSGAGLFTAQPCDEACYAYRWTRAQAEDHYLPISEIR